MASFSFVSLLLLATCLSLVQHVDQAQAATVKRHLRLTWETGAPNGQAREMILINGAYPGPALVVDEDDEVEITVHNDMPRNTSVHWHGLAMRGTPWSDGVIGLGQTPIRPGASYVYRFTASPPGTHWYHSHEKMSLYDGLYGALFVRPKRHEHDMRGLWAQISSDPADVAAMAAAAAAPELLLLSDWSRFTSDETWAANEASRLLVFCADSILLNGRGAVYCPPLDFLINQTAPGIQESAFPPGEHVTDKGCFPFTEAIEGPWFNTSDPSQVPWGMNEGCVPSTGSQGNATVVVDPAHRWVSLNLICTTINKQPFFSIDQHPLWIYEVDGHYVEPVLYVAAALSPGERFSAMVRLDKPPGVYTMRVPDSGVSQVISGFGHLVYANNASSSSSSSSQEDVMVVDPQPYVSYGGEAVLDVTTTDSYATYNLTGDHMVPWPATATLPYTGPPDEEYLLVIGRMNASIQYTMNTKYLYPAYFEADTPLLHLGPNATLDDPAAEGLVIRTRNGSWVDIILQVSTLPGDTAAIEHVIHKHGSRMWRIGQGHGAWNYSSVAEAMAAEPASFDLVRPGYRDTWMTMFSPVPEGGFWTVHRYLVDNPGPWLYHCHFELHQMGGMGIAFLDGVDAWPEVPPEYALPAGDCLE